MQALRLQSRLFATARLSGWRAARSQAYGYSTKAKSEEEKRIQELEDAQSLNYPRIRPDRNAISCEAFRTRFASLKPKESLDSDTVTLRGTSD